MLHDTSVFILYSSSHSSYEMKQTKFIFKITFVLNAWRRLVTGSVFDFVVSFEKIIKACTEANPIFKDIMQDAKDFEERYLFM